MGDAGAEEMQGVGKGEETEGLRVGWRGWSAGLSVPRINDCDYWRPTISGD